MGKTALLVLNGPLSSREVSQAENEAIDVTIAADGGANRAIAIGIHPNIIIGDFDSVTQQTRQLLCDCRWIHKPNQETCDLEKALVLCQEEEVTNLKVVGLAGGRLDHTLSNLSVLARYDHCFQMDLFTETADVFIVRNMLSLPGFPGQLVSLIPMGTVEGVETQGLKFPLRGESLAFGMREGASNKVIENHFSVLVSSGVLIVFRSLRGI